MVHAATPQSAVIGIDITITDDRFEWRGASVMLDDDPHVLAGDVCALVRSCWRSDDVPIDDDTFALKVVRSGAHHVAFGADFYIPRQLCVDATFPDAAAIARAYLRSSLRSSGTDFTGGSGVQQLSGTDCLVADNGRVVTIVSSQTGHCDSDETRPWDSIDTVDAVGVELAAAFGVGSFDAATIGARTPDTIDVDYVGARYIDGVAYEIIVPATLGAACVLGAPHGAAASAVRNWYQHPGPGAWFGVDGYTPIAPAGVEPGWLARHEASGIVVIIRPRQ